MVATICLAGPHAISLAGPHTINLTCVGAPGGSGSMFTPPVHAHGLPPILPEGDPDQDVLGARLMRFYPARPGGDGNNVYYRIVSGKGGPNEVGTVTDTDPVTTYGPDGQPLIPAWSDVEQVWWAGHEPVEVTDAQAEALVAAGYTLT